MKKTMKNLLLMGLVTLAAGVFTACSSSDDGGGIPVVNPDGPGGGGSSVGGMITQALSGIVRDTDGNAIAGVTVTSGTSVATTNSEGMFTFKTVLANGGRIIVKFHKNGYFDNTRAAETSQTGNWEVVLIKKGSSISDTKSFGAGDGGTLSTGDGMKVVLTGGSFKDEATGTNYTGNVNADLAYLNPDDKSFSDMMPGGDLIAVGEEGPDASLLSYGMIAVNLTDDDGKKLNLKDGATAKVTFPIPESLKGKTPATIPLWSFNEETGKWEKDGEAKLAGDHYEGSVKHFSWWNLDYPYQQGSIEGYVKNQKGEPIPFITVHIGQITGMTDEKGYYQHKVVANEDFDVWVDGADYNGVPGVLDKVTIKVNVYENRKDVNLTLPTIPTIRGTVKNADGTNTIASLYIEYGGKKTKAIISKSDGTFQTYAPLDYTGPATLVGRTAADREKRVDFTLDGTEKNLNLVFDGPKAKNSLLITFEDGRSVSIDLSKLTANINDDYISINTNGESAGYFNGSVYKDSEGNTQASVGFGYPGAKEQTWCSTRDVILSTFNYDTENVTCQFAGSGVEYDNTDWSAGTKETKFIFETTELTAPVAMIVQRLFNVIPKSIGFPSFTPQLDTPSPLVIFYAKSLIGKGGQAVYNGGLAEFNILKAQADASGITFVKEDSYDTEDWHKGHDGGEPKMGKCTERIYYADKKFILIAYDTAFEGIDFSSEEGLWYVEEGMVPVKVVVFDNLASMEDYQQYIHQMRAKVRK